jgi:hypothetical protein
MLVGCLIASARSSAQDTAAEGGTTPPVTHQTALADERASQQRTQTSTCTGAPVLDPTDERDVETELRQGYLGTARRKGRQQTSRTYDPRAASRLYQLRKLARE